MKIRIATRESRLALWQAHHVRDCLQELGHEVEIIGMTTTGDQILDRSLSKVGGKGLFVKELEAALHEDRADLAVHSLKDVPMDLPEGFVLAGVMQREDPRDAVVLAERWYDARRDLPLALWPDGTRIGTSSLRRVAVLQEWMRQNKRHWTIEPVRGNLDTRLRKLDEGQFEVLVLAAAGLKRLGLESRIHEHLEPELMLPAAGQGALGLEVAAHRRDVARAVTPLIDLSTELACEAERAVSRTMGGSCSMPLAAHAVWRANALWLRAGWQHGATWLEAQAYGEVEDSNQARALGTHVASLLHAAAQGRPRANLLA